MASGNEHQIKGRFSQLKGAIKEGFGALTGNRSTEMEGKGERAGGALREGYGRLKSDVTGENDVNRANDSIDRL